MISQALWQYFGGNPKSQDLLQVAEGGDQGDVLILTSHHVIRDGWAERQLVQQLSTAYDAALAASSQQTGSKPDVVAPETPAASIEQGEASAPTTRQHDQEAAKPSHTARKQYDDASTRSPAAHRMDADASSMSSAAGGDAVSQGLDHVLAACPAASLPVLPVQYTDFAHWQRQQMDSRAWEGQIEYWREQLAGIPEALDLPSDLPRPRVPSGEGYQLRMHIPPELYQDLQTCAAGQQATVLMVLAATFQVGSHVLQALNCLSHHLWKRYILNITQVTKAPDLSDMAVSRTLMTLGLIHGSCMLAMVAYLDGRFLMALRDFAAATVLGQVCMHVAIAIIEKQPPTAVLPAYLGMACLRWQATRLRSSQLVRLTCLPWRRSPAQT